jgi:hypothetical protein
MPDELRQLAMQYAYELEGARYDKKAILGILSSLVFKTSLPACQHEHQWYCTEAVRKFYLRCGSEWDVWRKKQPTPYTTEKRQRAGLLTILGGYTPAGCPTYPRC